MPNISTEVQFGIFKLGETKKRYLRPMRLKAPEVQREIELSCGMDIMFFAV